MIEVACDCHTHWWTSERELGPVFAEAYARACGKGAVLSMSEAEYLSHASGARRTVLLGLKSRALGLNIDNETVGRAARENAPRIVGFGCVDVNDPEAPGELQRFPALGLKGVKLAPAYQAWHPWSRRAYAIYGLAQGLNLPIMWHQGSTFVSESPLEHCRPFLLDRVARAFPALRMVVAHLGYPWAEETIALCRKHEHVYADVSALASRPAFFRYYLARAHESGVSHKLLFGSDYPFATIGEMVAGIRRACSGQGRSLAGLAGDLLARDALRVLGIA